KIPGGETGTDVRVSASVPIKSAGRRRPDECIRVEPLAGFAEDHGATETRIQERPHGIPGVASIRGVITQLRSEWESGLHGKDARHRPTARSEERRVGKESRYRRCTDIEK